MDGAEEREKVKPQYTMAGIMYFLQQEARRHEKERSEWAVQKALLQVRDPLWQLDWIGLDLN